MDFVGITLYLHLQLPSLGRENKEKAEGGAQILHQGEYIITFGICHLLKFCYNVPLFQRQRGPAWRDEKSRRGEITYQVCLVTLAKKQTLTPFPSRSFKVQRSRFTVVVNWNKKTQFTLNDEQRTMNSLITSN